MHVVCVGFKITFRFKLLMFLISYYQKYLNIKCLFIFWLVAD